MDDELAFSSHITLRGRVYHYVRRVPKDLLDAFSYERVQRSLRTRDKSQAYKAAADVHSEYEALFVEARRARGTTSVTIPVGDWEWPDWQSLADWFQARLVEADWQARIRNLPGEAFVDGVDRKLFRRDDASVKQHLALQRELNALTVLEYAEARLSFVQAGVRSLGVPLSRTQGHFTRFMAACQKAELLYLKTFLDREGGRMEEAPHPDTVQGRWKRSISAQRDEQMSRILGTPLATPRKVGKTLEDCLRQWEHDRTKANKRVTVHGVGEKQFAIKDFRTFAGIRDIGEITRAKIIEYRDHLSRSDLKTPTYNKRVGQITTLLTTAKKAGWIEQDITGDILIDVPSGTNEREPFSPEDLNVIFGHTTFTKGHRSGNRKAAGEVEFWLPVISLTSGLISSEIMQLGPDTVRGHPQQPDIVCFEVTNANGRSIKELSRKRYVPIHQALLDGGLMHVVQEAAAAKRTYLWKDLVGKDVTSASNMFSAFWSEQLRSVFEITDAAKTLYSFRHYFRDALSYAGATDYEKDQLMGHAEAGTGAKYGAKKAPRVVDIVRLEGLIQKISWPCLNGVRWPR